MISIIVASFKPLSELQSIKKEIESTVNIDNINYELILTCQEGKSASINRNFGLNHAKGEYIIQVDDDILGFYNGWVNDLIEPLLKDPFIVFSSARLMKLDGVSLNCMNGSFPGSESIMPWVEIPSRRLPSACVAFKKSNLRFNENFIGSGFEDSLYEWELVKIFPQGKFVIVNKCKLIHKNEQKNQTGAWDAFNRRLFHQLTEVS